MPELIVPILPPREMPTIEILVANFSEFLPTLEGFMDVSSESKFNSRLTKCRQCPLWLETAPFESGACSGAQKLIWRELEPCPENKWEA